MFPIVIYCTDENFKNMKIEDIERTDGSCSVQELFEEIKEAALRERLGSFEQYRDLVDEIVEEKRIYGFFGDHDDVTQIKKDLEMKWSEIKDILEKNAGKPLP